MISSNKITLNLGSLQKTVFLPVVARAMESKKTKPVLSDIIALEIMERTDHDFAPLISSVTEISRMEWIVRSVCFERLIRDYIRRYPQATIINIGCGLDTTYERVNNGTVLWYDLDLADVIELRKFFMKETENRKFISSSFLEDTWYRHLNLNNHVLFVAAGVYYYYEEKTIKKFLIKLSRLFPCCEMVFDVASPYGVRAANRLLKKACEDEAHLKWGLKNVNALLSWNPKFRLLGKYNTYKQKGGSVNFKNRLLVFISIFLDIQYIVHLRVMFDYKHLH